LHVNRDAVPQGLTFRYTNRRFGKRLELKPPIDPGRDMSRAGAHRWSLRAVCTESGKEFAGFVAAALLGVLGLLPLATYLPALLKNRAVAELYVPTVLVFCEQLPELGVLYRLRHAEHNLCLSCRDESSPHSVVYRVQHFVSLECLFAPERGCHKFIHRLHISIPDLHAKALLMRRTNTTVDEGQREHLLILNRHVTERTLEVRNGIGLDELLHDVAVVHGDGDRADRGD
jgi:hypothetical protein